MQRSRRTKNIKKIGKKQRIIFPIILLILSFTVLIFREPKIDTFIEGIKAIVIITGGSFLLSRGYLKISDKVYSALGYSEIMKKYDVIVRWIILVLNFGFFLGVLFGSDYFTQFLIQSVTVGIYVSEETSKKSV